MRTNYHANSRPAYSSRAIKTTTPTCRSVAMQMLTPEQVGLALAAAEQVTDRHHQVSRAVERARYEADRAERGFVVVDPENRLVAANLESRWEHKLAALAEAEQALATAVETLTPLPDAGELEKLATDLPRLWHAETTSNKDRKRMLRTLIADVALLPETDPTKVRIGIRWHTGATDELRVARVMHPAPPNAALRQSPETVET